MIIYLCVTLPSELQQTPYMVSNLQHPEIEKQQSFRGLTLQSPSHLTLQPICLLTKSKYTLAQYLYSLFYIGFFALLRTMDNHRFLHSKCLSFLCGDKVMAFLLLGDFLFPPILFTTNRDYKLGAEIQEILCCYSSLTEFAGLRASFLVKTV